MLDVTQPTEELPGATAPVLSAAVLARIHELNLDYIELLAAEHNAASAGDGQLQHLPCKLPRAIAELSPTARASLAALPYTLYSLGFEDEKFWRSLAEPAALAASLSMSSATRSRTARRCKRHCARSRCCMRGMSRRRVRSRRGSSMRCRRRRAAVDGHAAVVRQASRRASRLAAAAALADESRLLAGPGALRGARQISSGSRLRRLLGSQLIAARAAGIGVAVAALAGALSRMTVAQRAAARDGVVAELRANVVERRVEVLIAAASGTVNRSSCGVLVRSVAPTPSRRTAARGCSRSHSSSSFVAASSSGRVSWVAGGSGPAACRS